MLHLVEHQGRWFGHFPPGWPALLALGELVGTAWLVGPLAGGLAVLAWGLVLRRAEPEPAVRSGALLLFALAPFPAFMAGSVMSHTAALMWPLLALAGWLRLLERPSLATALGCGAAVGMAAITRPADALAFGIPALIWLAVWWREARANRAALILVAGATIPIVGMLIVNAATTGSAWTSGYQLLWGPNVGLGFHPAPYGPDHTVLRGFELLSLYLLRLNRYLFEAPIPSLLLAAVALLAWPGRLDRPNRYLAAAAASCLAVYSAYWHDGFFLGPRFIYPVVPVVALWTARLPAAVGRFGSFARRAAASALAIAAVGALALGIPERAGQNAAIQPAMRFDPDRAAAEAGIRNAVVLVRETWGAELLARLWALGATRPAAERYYRNIDACRLEHALAAVEAGAGPLGARLDPLLADSARLVPSPWSPDSSERALPGSSYDPRCLARVADDRAGTALLAPTLLTRRPDLVFGRDLPGRNGKLVAAHPGKAVYLLYRAPTDSAPTFHPLRRDSVLGAERPPPSSDR
jgi:hypothetical protein